MCNQTASHRLLGILCDIGLPRFFTGCKGLKRILSTVRSHHTKIFQFNQSFLSGNATFDSLGRVSIQFQNPPGVPPVYFELEIVAAKTPALLGFDGMDRESITL